MTKTDGFLTGEEMTPLRAMGFAHFRRETLLLQVRPRMRKEFAPLYEGSKLIGQLMIERPFEARDYLSYLERVHPDDQAVIDRAMPGEQLACLPVGVRIQRFNLYKGRYVLAGTEGQP